MFLKNQTNTFKSIFTVASNFEPATVEEVVDAETGEIYNELKIEKPKPKKPRYLPGQKLLKRLAKDKKNKDMDKEKLNMAQLEHSIAHVLRLF